MYTKKMKVPKVKFKVDEELDIQVTRQFLGLGTVGGLDFRTIFTEHYPQFENMAETDIDAFLSNLYKKNVGDIEERIKEFQLEWESVANKFWETSKNLFKDQIDFQDEYIAYITLNPFSPRFLEDQSFMIFVGNESGTAVIAHELMHFFFYEYTSKKFPKVFAELDPDSEIYWDMAEVFNNVVLDSEMFNFIAEEECPYPDHKKYIEAAKAIFDPNDIDNFILGLKNLIENFDENKEVHNKANEIKPTTDNS